jgi:hypothetical protein
MMGQPLLKFVPLHESALERAPDALEWVSPWVRNESGRSNLLLVSPNQWPEGHPTGGTYLWFPRRVGAPAGAPAAVDWLVQSIHKRPFSTHMFVCPRIMTAWWYKILNKASDIVLNLYTGAEPCWSKDQFEPLTIAVCLPLSCRSLWRHKGTSHVCGVHRELQRIWKAGCPGSRFVLRKLLSRTRGMAQVSWDMVR